MTPDYEKLYRQYIKGVKQSGSDSDQFVGFCPFHDDKKNRSFSFNQRHGLSNCFKGCFKGNAYQFAEKVGYGNPNEFIDNNAQVKKNSEQMNLPLIGSDKLLKKSEKYHKNLPSEEIKERPVLGGMRVGKDDYGRATYPYHDIDGNIIGIKYHKGKNGESPYWEGDGTCKFYGLHIIKGYDRNQPLIICEGENDNLWLRRRSCQATTGSAGAGSIPKDLSPIDGFAEYIIIYDNDSAGKKGAEKLAERIVNKFSKTVKIAKWREGLPDGYDISDDVETGFKEVDHAIVNAKVYELPEKMIENVSELNDDKPEFPEFPEFIRLLPKNKLTKSLSELVEVTQDTSDAPDEFIIPSFLAYWNSVVGNKLIGPNELRTNINIILFAKSTNIRKSTSIKIAGLAFYKVQKELDEEFELLLRDYQQSHSAWRDLPLRQRAQAPEPIAPLRRNIILSSDFSDAGFFVMMQDNSVSGIIVTGEYADYHKNLHRDMTGMANAMLVAYDNDRMSRITRTHGTEVINNPTFSVLGATTFGNFRKVFRGGEKENGTLQRILAVVLLKPTKQRLSFLNRSEIDETFIEQIIDQIKNWLKYDGELEVFVPDEIDKQFKSWEEEFIQNAKRDYGDEIIPHVDRMVASCFKLTMLCESLEIKDPREIMSLELTNESLNCAIAMIDEVFLPSMGYLLKNEIIMNKAGYNSKVVEKIMKKAGGKIIRSELLRESNLSARDMKEAIQNLYEKEFVKEEYEYNERPQGGGNPKTIYVWIGK